jgi:DNA-binding MarR family transcriptional regulator
MHVREIDEILNALRVIVQALRVSSRAAEKQVGLSGAQLFVLEKLSEVESLSMNELAERTHTHQSSVSVVVAKLVRRKLVTRSRSHKDGRQVVLHLTEAGRKRLQTSPPTAQEQLLAALRRMAPDERVLLSSSLTRLLRLAGMGVESPELFFERPVRLQKAISAKR